MTINTTVMSMDSYTTWRDSPASSGPTDSSACVTAVMSGSSGSVWVDEAPDQDECARVE